MVLKGSGHGTITSLHGEYELDEIPAGEQNLIFSFMGYETREVALGIQEGEVLEFDLDDGVRRMVRHNIEMDFTGDSSGSRRLTSLSGSSTMTGIFFSS